MTSGGETAGDTPSHISSGVTQKSEKEFQSEEAQLFAQQWAEGRQRVETAGWMEQCCCPGSRTLEELVPGMETPDHLCLLLIMTQYKGGISQGHTVTL